jgi:hypothetical protein
MAQKERLISFHSGNGFLKCDAVQFFPVRSSTICLEIPDTGFEF